MTATAIQPLVGAARLMGCNIYTYGAPKTGKTQTAASFPSPVVILGTEDGHRFLEGRAKVIRIPSGALGWDVFTGEKRFTDGRTLAENVMALQPATIVVDTVAPLFVDSALAALCPTGWPKDDHGRSWKAFTSAVSKAFNDFCTWANGATRVFIDHEGRSTIQTGTNEGDYTHIEPAIPEWLRRIMLPRMHFIWYLGTDRNSNRDLYVGPRRGLLTGGQDPLVTTDILRGLPREDQFEWIATHLYQQPT